MVVGKFSVPSRIFLDGVAENGTKQYAIYSENTNKPLRSGLLVFSEFEYSGQSDFWWRTLNRMFVGEQTVADYPY